MFLKLNQSAIHCSNEWTSAWPKARENGLLTSELVYQPVLERVTEALLGLWVVMGEIIAKPGIVAHTFNPSTAEAEAGGYLWVPGQPGLQTENQTNQDYIDPVSKKKYINTR